MQRLVIHMNAPGELGMHSDIKYLYPNLNNKIIHLVTAEILL